MSEKRVHLFPGQEIDVSWDGRLCIHIAECGQAKGDLFVAGRDSWCQPDLAESDEVRTVVERCPTGALSYVDRSGNAEQPAAENSITVLYNGPLYARGDLQLEGAPEDMPGITTRAALCRCGKSANKPFCDNSHIAAGFSDFGAVGDAGPGCAGSGGKLVIKPLKNGPLLFSGKLRIDAGSGRRAWQGEQVALCRCGASKNKPFCDGSHKEAGFQSE